MNNLNLKIKLNLICLKRNLGLYFFNSFCSFLTWDFNRFFFKHFTTVIRNADGIKGGDDKVFYKSIYSSPNVYINAINGISVGKNLLVGPHVGLISSSHKICKGYPPKENVEPIVIGDDCWLGMGCKIMPGVNLGNNVVVAAGAVVTKSFVNGDCILAGSPAKVIKFL